MATGDLAVVSLFSGAGGLDLGLEQAGFETVAQIEMDRDAVVTLEKHAASRDASPIIHEAKLEDVPPRELRRSLGLRRGALPLMAGGPPCQPFTTSGLRQGLGDRRAAGAIPSYLEYVEEFLPKVILFENVDGMLSAALQHRPLRQRGPGHPQMTPEERKGSFLQWLLGKLVALGYSVTWGVAEAADYGVPQLRQRAILMGVRGKTPCFLPDPTHGQPDQPGYRTLEDALSGLTEIGPVQPLSLRKRQVYEQIPPGGNWRDLSDGVQRATMGAAYFAEGGKSGWWRRLAWDAPAPTILGMPDHSSTALVHPDEVRCLSVAECAAVQTFPRGVEFGGKPRSQYQQIGNAVPPLLGEALGNHVRAFLDGVRFSEPDAPEWRQASANRRIGTHGWVTPGKDPTYHVSVKVRPDHIWADQEDVVLAG